MYKIADSIFWNLVFAGYRLGFRLGILTEKQFAELFCKGVERALEDVENRRG